jgi:hypothetical protein
MDGLTLIRKLRQILGETNDNEWLDLKYSYDCLYDAAIATADATQALTKVQTITTSGAASNYLLNNDFLKLYIQNEKMQPFVRYYNGSAYSQVTYKPYNYVFLAQHSASASIPSCFTIIDAVPGDRLTGTTTTAGAEDAGGESTLTDSTALFNTASGANMGPTIPAGWTAGTGWTLSSTLSKASDGTGTCAPTTALSIIPGRVYKVTITGACTVNSIAYTLGGASGTTITTSFSSPQTEYITALTTGNLIFTPTITGARANFTAVDVRPWQQVQAGDFVHNSTGNSTGIVVGVTSDTALQTALFMNDTGAIGQWTLSDTYYIEPQGRFQLIFDPPNLTAGHLATVPYVYRPTPVYSYYRTYPFPVNYQDALVAYAAWKYKCRNQELNFGDGYYKMWDNAVRRLGSNVRGVTGRTRIGVNMTPGGRRDGTNI